MQSLERTLRMTLADRREMITALHQGRSEVPFPFNFTSEHEEEAGDASAHEGGGRHGAHANMFHGNPLVPALRPPWEEHKDAASGKVFYFNKDTSTSQWEKPDLLALARRARESTGLAHGQMGNKRKAPPPPPRKSVTGVAGGARASGSQLRREQMEQDTGSRPRGRYAQTSAGEL